jgi:hypothetical protein
LVQLLSTAQQGFEATKFHRLQLVQVFFQLNRMLKIDPLCPSA